MYRKPGGLTLLAVSTICILVLAACNCAPTLTYIVITPATATTSINGTQQYTAAGYYSNGSINTSLSVAWGSTASSVASITSGGLATGVSIGTTTITATALGITATPATLTVNQLTAIVIAPLNQTIAINGTEPYTATGTFLNAGGTTTTGDVTALVTWNTGSAAIATFSTTTPGLATGVAGGTTTVSASLYGVNSNTTNLTVSGTTLVITPSVNPIAVGNSVSFTVVEMQTGGSTNPTTYPVTWTSSTPGVANIVANGNSAAIGAGFIPGTTTITATEASPTPYVGTITLTVVAGTASYAYVSNSAPTYSIGAYAVTASTAPYLTPGAVTTTGGFSPSQTVLNPNGLFMYVVGGSSSVLIYTYAIAPATGVLTSTGSPVTADPGSPEPTFGLTDPYGRFLYVCDQFDSVYTSTAAIYVYTINQTTGLLTAGTPVTANVDGCTSMLIDQSGSYLYAVNNFASNANGISAYSINQTTGALTALSPATYQTGSGPVFSTWDPTGTYLFAADSLDGTVTGYTLGTGGALTSMTTTTVTGATSLSSVAIPPSGSILYVLDAGPPSNVYAYSLSAGTVGSAVGTPQPAGQNPSYMSIDPTGAILAVNNVGDGTTAASAGISVFTIGSTGTLTAITPFVTTGAAPYFVTFYNVP